MNQTEKPSNCACNILSKNVYIALASVLSWLGILQQKNCKVAGSIPCQGTCLGCRFIPGQGSYKRQLMDVSHIHDSPILSLSLPLSLESIKINK